MALRTHLREWQREAEQESSHVRDFRVFTLNYLPEEPIERPEMEQISRAILRYGHSGIPTNIFIFGSRGCGKTLTLKHLQSAFSQEGITARILYVSARGNNTSFKMLARLLNVTPRGYSLSELFDRFCETHPGKTVLIIDEIDFMSDKDPGREILYMMSRAEQNYMLILSANNPRFLHNLDSMTRSSLGPVPLHFRNYDAEQIFSILKQRAETGLKSCSDSLLREIAGMVTKLTNSDVRVAIRTLYYAATDKYPSVEQCFEHAQRDLVADVMRGLNYNNILQLQAVLGSKERLVKEVYREYLRICEGRQEKAFGYTRWLHNLGYLQSVGLVLLISTHVKTGVGATRTNKIEPLFEEALLKNAFQEKLCK